MKGVNPTMKTPDYDEWLGDNAPSTLFFERIFFNKITAK